MLAIPAIDLSGGRAVRLVGPEVREYGNPWTWAEKFLGARRVHVVDIDAALGRGNNWELLMKLVRWFTGRGVEVQVGGGLRTAELAVKVMEAGGIPIVGTLAFKDRGALAKLLDRGPVIVSVDSLQGRVRVRGWREDTGLSVEEALEDFTSMGVKQFLLTGISRDGSLSGIDESLTHLPALFRADLIYAGGVSSLEDLMKLRDLGFWGAVVGRAIYETSLLQELIKRRWDL